MIRFFEQSNESIDYIMLVYYPYKDIRTFQRYNTKEERMYA